MSAATAMPADIARWATKAVGPISEVRDASHERVNSRVRKGPRAQRGPVLREGRTRAGVLHQGDLRLPARGAGARGRQGSGARGQFASSSRRDPDRHQGNAPRRAGFVAPRATRGTPPGRSAAAPLPRSDDDDRRVPRTGARGGHRCGCRRGEESAPGRRLRHGRRGSAAAAVHVEAAGHDRWTPDGAASWRFLGAQSSVGRAAIVADRLRAQWPVWTGKPYHAEPDKHDGLFRVPTE